MKRMPPQRKRPRLACGAAGAWLGMDETAAKGGRFRMSKHNAKPTLASTDARRAPAPPSQFWDWCDRRTAPGEEVA